MARALVCIALSLLVLASASLRKKQAASVHFQQRPPMEDEYEYGDREEAVSQADSSDFSLHQFITEDDGREGTTVTGDDAGKVEMERSSALAADDHFDSEDTPDNSDSFVQTGKKTLKTRASAVKSQQRPPMEDEYEYGDREEAVSQADSSDFSLHQFITEDDGREGTTVTGDDAGKVEMERSSALAADDHFDSEDTPDNSDSFVQTGKKTLKTRASAVKSQQRPPMEDEYEYGDREEAVSQADSSDFSLHQFITEDDGREGTTVTGDDAGKVEMERSSALAADDHFDSEDTPDNSDSFAQTGKQVKSTKQVRK